jgi:hypothetical protein
MLIFLDTEFTDLKQTAKLISIGLVDETGTRTFYAELSDTYVLADCSPFAQEAVLPLLEGGAALKTLQEAGHRLSAWIADLPGDECASFVSDSVGWDWPFVWDIFKAHAPWPDRLSREPVPIHPMVGYPAFERACERAYRDGLREHHALDDARANRAGWVAAALTEQLLREDVDWGLSGPVALRPRRD